MAQVPQIYKRPYYQLKWLHFAEKKKHFLDDSTYLNLNDSEIKENDEF